MDIELDCELIPALIVTLLKDIRWEMAFKNTSQRIVETLKEERNELQRRAETAEKRLKELIELHNVIDNQGIAADDKR